MPYRDAPAPPAAALPDIARPARVAAAFALASLVIVLVSEAPSETKERFFEEHSSLGNLLWDVFVLLQVGILAAGVPLARAVEDPASRRLVRIAVAALTFAAVMALWFTLVPSYSLVRSGSSVRLVPEPMQTLAGIAWGAGLAAMLWGMSARDSRTVAALAIVIAAGMAATRIWMHVERPWVQLYEPDGPSAGMAAQSGRLFEYLPLVALAFEGLRRRREPPASAELASDRERSEAERAYDSLAALVAIAFPLVTMPALFAFAILAIAVCRVDGPLSLEHFEPLVVALHGAFFAAGVLVFVRALRVRSRRAATFAALATFVCGAVSVVFVMRGPWRLPVTSIYFFENLERVWTVGAAALVVVCIVFVRAAFGRVAVLSVSEKDDVGAQLGLAATGIAQPLVGALVLAVVTLVIIAWGDSTSNVSTHRAAAGCAAFASVVALLFAIVGWRAHERARSVIAEAMRRRATTRERDEDDEPALV